MSQHRFTIWSIGGALDVGARRGSRAWLSGIDSSVLTYYRPFASQTHQSRGNQYPRGDRGADSPSTARQGRQTPTFRR
jgi:hypothetical protein